VHVFHATLAGARHESTPYIGPRRAGARRFQKETTMVTEDIAQRSAEAWLEAWNAHDLEAIMACYAAHPTLTSPRVVQRLDLPDGTVRGREQLRDYFAHGLRVAPALHFALRDILMGVEGVAIAYTRETGVQVVDAHKLDVDGKITEAHVYVAPKRAPARGT
jgi:hypothetical protein